MREKMLEKRTGYVRCETLFPIEQFQILEGPNIPPTLRVLAILTRDGALAIQLNKEIATTLGQALLHTAKEMPEKKDLT